MRPTRREIAWLLASWLGWATVAAHIRGPWDTLFGGGDHWSHIGCAELFLHHGFGIWDHAPSEYCTTKPTPKDPEFQRQSNCLPCDTCDLRDLPALRPMCINWQPLGPQAYPPGLILFALPQAILYQHSRISFRALNVFTIWEYLLAAHLLFWVMLRMVFPPRQRDDLPGGAVWELGNPWLRLGLFSLLYLWVIKHVLNGFYDPLAIFATFLGVYFLAKKRPVDAVVALSASLFLHYRALWYVPVCVVAFFRALPVVWASPRKHALKIGLAAVMFGLFAYSLFLIFPFLKGFPDTNPIAWRHMTRWNGKYWDLLFPLAGIFLYLAWGRHWLMLASMAWQLIIIGSTLQIMDWHALFLLPMLGVARLDEERGVMLAAVVFYLVEAAVIFNALPYPGELISTLGIQLGPMTFH